MKKEMMRGALREALCDLKSQMRKRRGSSYASKEDEEDDGDDNEGERLAESGEDSADALEKGDQALSSKVKSAEKSANDEIIAKSEGKGDLLSNEIKGFMKGQRKRKPMKSLRVVATDINQGKKRGRPRKDA